MQEIKAYLTEIKPKIITELNKARQSILVASAYFKDTDLANLLIEKANAGLSVDLIISDSSINDKDNKVDFDAIKNAGINFYRLGEEKSKVMHHKFCVIDLETLITGSYNWTYGAINNQENIVILKDKNLANQYAERFYELRNEIVPLGSISSEIDLKLLPIELKLSLNKIFVRKNDAIKIDWKATNADLITINGEEVEANGQKEINIFEDTQIVLVGKNTETGKQLQKSFLVKVAYHSKIKFEVENDFLIRSQFTFLNWDVENAKNVIIEPHIGAVNSKGKVKINPSDSIVYTLIATDFLGVETKNEISINVYPTPVLERLVVPSPTDIKIEATFETLSHQIPSALNLNIVKNRSFDFPRLKSLNTYYEQPKPTVKQLSETLKVSTNDLYRSIGEVENLKMLFFDWLEKLFECKPKMTEIIKTIRKHYG